MRKQIFLEGDYAMWSSLSLLGINTQLIVVEYTVGLISFKIII